jgi:NAD(P)H dehydrogenase (quinone)
MKAFVVYAHPEPTSFNGALRDTAVRWLTNAGHEVKVSDLYAEDFDPRAGRHDFTGTADANRFDYQAEQVHATETDGFAPTLAREQERLLWCDLLILQYPLWWGGLPAILKGWFDRVLAYKKFYDLANRYDNGVLKGRKVVMSITTGGTPERFSEGGMFGEIGPILHPVDHCILRYVGLEILDPFIAYAAGRVTPEDRAAVLRAWEARLGEITAA